MLGIFLILLILFLIGLPFYWIYKLIFNKKKPKVIKKPKIAENESETLVSDLITKRKFLFMEDYRMWKGLSESEKKDRLTCFDPYKTRELFYISKIN